jgi:hypothetical protein
VDRKTRIALAVALLGALVVIGVNVATDDARRAPARPRPTADRAPAAPREIDPGPRRTRVRRSEARPDSAQGGGGGTGGGGAANEITSAEVRARFANIRAQTQPLGSDCEQFVAALGLVREGMREAGGRPLGGRSAAENLELCRAFPAEVRACLAPTHHALHVDECRGVLERFGATRDDPGWLERLSGHPASERPEPNITEAEARAMNARRRGR